MTNVTLTIGGRAYAVACAPGEEEHVAGLGRMIDGRIQAMDGGASLGETRSLLFAALLLADRVHELEGSAGDAPAPFPAARFAALAERLTRLADLVEGQAGIGG